jgi:hypothetical protein
VTASAPINLPPGRSFWRFFDARHAAREGPA